MPDQSAQQSLLLYLSPSKVLLTFLYSSLSITGLLVNMVPIYESWGRKFKAVILSVKTSKTKTVQRNSQKFLLSFTHGSFLQDNVVKNSVSSTLCCSRTLQTNVIW